MNREIKFRAWDTTEKKMHHEISLMFANDLNGVFEGLNECGCIVMQYTGLKDKNEKEIYEGDIVLYDRNINHNIDKYKYVVSYGNGLFYLDHHFSEITDGANWGLLEIIGNIHENPELLKEAHND